MDPITQPETPQPSPSATPTPPVFSLGSAVEPVSSATPALLTSGGGEPKLDGPEKPSSKKALIAWLGVFVVVIGGSALIIRSLTSNEVYKGQLAPNLGTAVQVGRPDAGALIQPVILPGTSSTTVTTTEPTPPPPGVTPFTGALGVQDTAGGRAVDIGRGVAITPEPSRESSSETRLDRTDITGRTDIGQIGTTQITPQPPPQNPTTGGPNFGVQGPESFAPDPCVISGTCTTPITPVSGIIGGIDVERPTILPDLSVNVCTQDEFSCDWGSCMPGGTRALECVLTTDCPFAQNAPPTDSGTCNYSAPTPPPPSIGLPRIDLPFRGPIELDLPPLGNINPPPPAPTPPPAPRGPVVLTDPGPIDIQLPRQPGTNPPPAPTPPPPPEEEPTPVESPDTPLFQTINPPPPPVFTEPIYTEIPEPPPPAPELAVAEPPPPPVIDTITTETPPPPPPVVAFAPAPDPAPSVSSEPSTSAPTQIQENNIVISEPAATPAPTYYTNTNEPVVAIPTPTPAPTPRPSAPTQPVSAAKPTPTKQPSPVERMHGAFIQGGTGPEVMLYPVAIAVANGLWYLGRRKKKN